MTVSSPHLTPVDSFVPARILLAEDNADMREYVRRPLSSKYEVVTVSDGKAALRVTRENSFGLVLMDMTLPGLDGLYLLRELRADERTREVPIILLSHGPGEGSRIEGLESGADDYLVRPFSARELLARVGTHMEIARLWKEAGQALREGERRFQEMIDSLPAAVYTTDAMGRLTHFNRAAIDFSGRVPELGTDRWCVSWKLYYPDGTLMPHDECPMAIALKEGRAVRGVEAIAERPDGKRIWFEPYPTPLRDPEGRVIGGINMLLDITDRKKASEVQGKLAAIVEFSDDAVISKDLQGVITSWNRAAERLFGYTAQEAIGKSVTIIFPPERLEEEPRILELIRRGEPIEHYETVRRRKDGTLLDISLTVSPVRDDRGQIIGVSKIARDITARKRAEEALRESEERRRQDLERALKTEREITETIQRSLLPDRLPQFESVHLAARYMPASPEAAVGGDFYDVFTLPNGHLGLAIGDVAGYGVQAASVMGQVRMLLRAYAHEGHPPSTVIDRVNHLLGPGEMVTVLYLVLDSASGQMTYANAGHPPPLATAADGTSRFLYGVDPPLVGGSYQYKTFSATIAPASTVILYTDGLVESEKSIDVGLTRLAEVSTQNTSAALEDLASAIVNRLAGAERRDDVAFLAFRLQPIDLKYFRITLPSVPHSLPTLRFSLRRWLEASGVPAQDVFDIVVACGEAGTNVVEHAYGLDGGSLEIEAQRHQDRVALWIRDQGHWRPRSERGPGHGLAILQKIMDSVEVVRGPGGTTVKLERRLRLVAEV